MMIITFLPYTVSTFLKFDIYLCYVFLFIRRGYTKVFQKPGEYYYSINAESILVVNFTISALILSFLKSTTKNLEEFFENSSSPACCT